MGERADLPEVLPVAPPLLPLPVRGVAWASIAMGVAYGLLAVFLIYQGVVILEELSKPAPPPGNDPSAALAVACIEIMRPFLLILGMMLVVMLAFFAVLTAGLGALYCVAGVALQRGRRWARIMTLVLAGFAGVLALSGPIIWVRTDSRPARATVFLPTTAPGPGSAPATVPSPPPPGMSLEHILWHVGFCLVHGA
jgi:hypothetical protein